MKRWCDLCGGTTNVDELEIPHKPICPNHPDAIDDTPEPISNVTSLALHRVEKGAYPETCPAMQALDLARDWVRESGKDPDHVIVLIARGQEDGADSIKFFQTGTYRPHAQVGMVIEGLDMLRSSGWTEYGK